MSSVRQHSGETAAQYVDRIESELETARNRIERLDLEAESERAGLQMHIDALREEHADAKRERAFLREQLTELQQQILSTAAPRTRQQLARLLAGVLRGEDWRHGTWR